MVDEEKTVSAISIYPTCCMTKALSSRPRFRNTRRVWQLRWSAASGSDIARDITPKPPRTARWGYVQWAIALAKSSDRRERIYLKTTK